MYSVLSSDKRRGERESRETEKERVVWEIG